MICDRVQLIGVYRVDCVQRTGGMGGRGDCSRIGWTAAAGIESRTIYILYNSQYTADTIKHK